MADSNLNVPVIIQATRLDTSVLPRNIFSQSYLLYVIAQGTDVGNVANKANEAGKGAYDAQVKNDEQDVTLADHESRIEAAEATLINHEHRIAAAESTLADHEIRIKTLYNSVGRVGRAQMRNGIIGKAMEKSGGSPDQFLRQLNILQNQTGITFKGQDAAYLKGLKNYLQSTQQAAKAAVTTPTGQQTIPFIIGYGTAMNPATTGAAVSYGLLTRAYESEPFRNAMLRMANTPRGSTAFEKAMQQAQKAINALTQGAKSDALSE